MEEIKTEGVVLRRTYVGEKDAILKILTQKSGLLTASAKGVKSMKSKLAAGTAVFGYTDLVLIPGKSMYIVSQAVQKEGFYGLSQNIERLSYASYFADLVAAFEPDSEDAQALMPLLLNTLYLLSNTAKNMELVKCVFELRLLAHLGFAPELEGCCDCGDHSRLSFFSPSYGGVMCRSCGGAKDSSIVTEDSLSAMRYCLHADDKKAFSFALPQQEINEFARCTEKMCEHVLGRRLPALSYLKQITGKV